MSVPAKLGIVQNSQARLEPGDVQASFDLLLKAVREASPEDLPHLIGHLEQVKAVAWARLVMPTPVAQEHDELIDVGEAGRRLGISEDYLYRHHKEFAFTRHLGRKLLFSARGIEKHISRKLRT